MITTLNGTAKRKESDEFDALEQLLELVKNKLTQTNEPKKVTFADNLPTKKDTWIYNSPLPRVNTIDSPATNTQTRLQRTDMEVAMCIMEQELNNGQLITIPIKLKNAYANAILDSDTNKPMTIAN